MEKSTLRPGGLSLTAYAVEKAGLRAGNQVLDIGCGGGATVDWLRSRGIDAFGVDSAADGQADRGIVRADAACLPFETHLYDGVLFECSLSKIKTPVSALAEAKRVLKPHGTLIVSDLFAKAAPHMAEGLLGRIEPWKDILDSIQAAGFKLVLLEERPDALASYWAELLFNQGEQDACGLLGADMKQLKAAQCGYFLAIFGAVD